jgi:hypothetical protein
MQGGGYYAVPGFASRRRGWCEPGAGGGAGPGDQDRGEGARPEAAGKGDRAGAAAGVLVHHRGRWWTATRAQARDAPDTMEVSENSDTSVFTFGRLPSSKATL